MPDEKTIPDNWAQPTEAVSRVENRVISPRNFKAKADSHEHTVPDQSSANGEAPSGVESRVISLGSVKSVGIEPRMTLARRTLAAFVIDHQSAPIKLKHEFDFTSTGPLKTTEILKWSLTDEDIPDALAFTVEFEYRGREPVSQLCDNRAVHQKLRKLLFDLGLVFRSATGVTVNKLTIDPIVPAALTVSADLKTSIITITLRNVLLLGTTKYELASEHMDREFIDSLCGLLSGESLAFYALASALSRHNRH